MTVALAPPVEKRLYRFDGFDVDPVRRRLVRAGEPVAITPRAFSLLLILLERRGEVVEKEELIRRLWPDTLVTEANLTQNVFALRKALGERANEQRYVITVTGRGYSFVAEVEEAEAAPASRPEIPIQDLPLAVPPAAGPSRGRAGLAALVLVLLVAGLAAALLREREPAAAGAGEARPSLAVLGFKDLSGSPASAWLGPALTEMLTTELAAGGRVRVASGENVARARQSPESLDPGSLKRLHGILGCELLVVGSYLPLGHGEGARIRLDLRVLRLPGGDTVASLVELGTGRELFEMVARTGAELRQALGLAGLSPEQARVARALQPGNPEAARLYATGLARLRVFDPHAVDLLRRAAAADPGSPTIHSALAQAWAALGYDARAREEAARSVELAAALPRVERLAIEARAHQVSREWGRASEIYRSLRTFYPDELEHGLQLAKSLSEAGRNAEALAILEELRGMPPPAGQDPRIDLAEGTAAVRLLEPGRALQATRRAAGKGRASSEPLIVAQAFQVQGMGLLLQGDPAAANRLFEQARTAYRQGGDRVDMAASMALIGIGLQRQGDLAGAERIFLEAYGILRELGNVAGIAGLLGNLGILYHGKGDLDRALAVLDQSRARFAEIEDPLLETRVLNASTAVLCLKGDLEGARSRIEEVLALSRRLGSRNDEARAYAHLSAVLSWKGEVREAGRVAREAFEILRDSDPSWAATALAAWGDALVRQGDPAGARRYYEQALELKKKAGDRIGTAQVLGSLAWLESRTGDLAAARARNREQLRIAEETGARTLRSWGYHERGRVELAAGDRAAARRSLAAALAESSAAGEDLRATLIRTDLARLDLLEGAAGRAALAAGEAAAWCRERGNPRCEAVSLSVQAEALAEEGRAEEARQAAARIRILTWRGEDRDLLLTVAPGLARAEAAPRRSAS